MAPWRSAGLASNRSLAHGLLRILLVGLSALLLNVALVQIADALRALEDGVPARLEFGVSDQDAWNVGLACGGRIEIYVEAVR